MSRSITSRQPASGLLGEGFGGFMNAATQRVMQYQAYRRTVRELSELGAHELADLGLHHSEIQRVAHESIYRNRR